MSVSGHRTHSFYNFLLKNGSTARQQNVQHPLPSQVLYLWQVYVDNVDPFMKVLHVPSMTRTIRARGRHDGLDARTQALMSAISLAAVMSLREEEVCVRYASTVQVSIRPDVEKVLAELDMS